jgi:peptidoglycan/xylan/chitin deacetylase (PgdA/CDA1 family)
MGVRWFGVLLFLLLPAAAFAGGLITHGPRDSRMVALTFDVCQKPDKPAGFDRQLVEILRRERVPATFFLGGDWVRTHPQETRELAAEPLFELANHSFSHPDLRTLDATVIAAEVRRTDELLFELAGRRSRLFRLPYGWYDERVLAELDRLGVAVIQWDVVTGDPDPRADAAAILRQVEEQARGGSIVILHANGRGRHSAEALPLILAWLRRQGLTPVTVSELLAP